MSLIDSLTYFHSLFWHFYVQINDPLINPSSTYGLIDLLNSLSLCSLPCVLLHIFIHFFHSFVYPKSHSFIHSLSHSSLTQLLTQQVLIMCYTCCVLGAVSRPIWFLASWSLQPSELVISSGAISSMKHLPLKTEPRARHLCSRKSIYLPHYVKFWHLQIHFHLVPKHSLN